MGVGSLLTLLVTLIVLGVLLWAVQRLLGVLPVNEPFKTLIYVVLVVIILVVAVQALFGVAPGFPTYRWR